MEKCSLGAATTQALESRDANPSEQGRGVGWGGEQTEMVAEHHVSPWLRRVCGAALSVLAARLV